MGCGCSRSINITAPIPKVEKQTTRSTCSLCTKKHLGCASLVLESPIGSSSDVLLSRAQILMGEATQGYPWHRSYAVGCLALISEALALAGNPEKAQEIKGAQKKLEAGEGWVRPDLPNFNIQFAPGLAAAHLAEAAAECPEPKIKRSMELDVMVLANNPGYRPAIERWLKDVL